MTNKTLVVLPNMLAYQHGISNIVAGVAQTDYSGRPDCREEGID